MITISRSICIASTGYILGIIIGLYFKCIALYICTLIFILSILNIYENKKKVFIFLIALVISIIYISLLENSYESLCEGSINSYAIVVSDEVEKEYSIRYEIKLITNNKKMLLYLKKESINEKLKYGDLIILSGEIKKANNSRNYGGFNYRQYLKTKGIYGIINAEKVLLVKEQYKQGLIHNLQNKIKEKIKNNLNKNEGALLLGILMGNKDLLENEIINDFRDSSLSHILAVSGTHISYIILSLNFTMEKTKIGKRKGKIICIIFLSFFMLLTNCTPSVTRAVIMSNLSMCASLLHRKSDIYTNIFLSAIIILIINPYSIFDLGFQLSFMRNIRNYYIKSIYIQNIRK